MPDVRIIEIRQVADTNPARAGQPATWVMYTIEPGGPPRSIFIPKQNPPDTEIQAAIRTDIQRNTDLRGKIFTL